MKTKYRREYEVIRSGSHVVAKDLYIIKETLYHGV